MGRRGSSVVCAYAGGKGRRRRLVLTEIPSHAAHGPPVRPRPQAAAQDWGSREKRTIKGPGWGAPGPGRSLAVYLRARPSLLKRSPQSCFMKTKLLPILV